MNKDRYMFTVEIYDNEKKLHLFNEGFNGSSLTFVINKLTQILNILTGIVERGEK
jgi:hypothetical protein